MVPISSLRTLPWIPFIFIAWVDATTKSTVVDDSDESRMVYFPLGTWNRGNDCTECYASPVKDRTLNGTWRDNTASNDQPKVYFNFTFTGTAIEVRCILYDKIVAWIGMTNVEYSIDGVYRGTASYSPTNATDYLYNQSLFRINDLTNAEHTLHVDLLNPSMLLLDYLVYDEAILEAPTSGPPADTLSQKKINIAAVIGGIVACVSVVGGVILWFCYRRYNGRRKRLQQTVRPSPVLVEVSDSIRTPFQGKGLAHPTLPQMKHGTKSLSRRGAPPESTTPGDIPPYANPEDHRPGAFPSGHGDIRASLDESSFASTRTKIAAPVTLNTMQEDPQTSSDATLGMAFQGRNLISPPSNYHPPTMVSRGHETPLEEPVEEGLMSRHANTPRSASMPPPYSYG